MSASKFFTHPVFKPLAAVLATLLWGSAFPVIKLSYERMGIERGETFEQILFAGYRFTLAGLLVLLVMLALGIKFDRGFKPLAGAMQVGVFQTVLQYWTFYIGLSYSTGTISSIIAGTTSFFQLLLAHFMFRGDRLNRNKTVGVLIGAAGISAIYFQGETGGAAFGIGEALLLAAMFFGALGNVVTKKKAASTNIFYLTGTQMLLGGGVLLAVGAFAEGIAPFRFDGYSALMLVYLALLSSAGFLLWNFLMKYNSVGSVSMYLALIPVFGVILSSLMLGESQHWLSLVSLLMIVAGIAVVNRRVK